MMRILLTFVFTLNLALLTFAQPQTSEPVITIDRTACFGTCPVYSIEIYADGKVLYEGKEFVKTRRKAQGQITVKALEDLIQEFMKINYLDLKSKPDCPEEWTDNPSANTSLTWKGRHKEVTHYHGCRGSAVLEQLTQLEDKIDAAVNSGQWIK